MAMLLLDLFLDLIKRFLDLIMQLSGKRMTSFELNAQQISATLVQAKARSPLLKVKRDRSVLRASLELSARKQRILVAKCHHDQEKVANPKRINNQLMVDILREKRASNNIINNIMIDARWLSSEALEMMAQANEKYDNAEEPITNERRCTSAQLREERTHNSRESARLRQKLVTTINKVDQEHESSINLFRLKSDKKYNKAIH